MKDLRQFYRWGGSHGLGRYVKAVGWYLLGCSFLLMFIVIMAIVSKGVGQ